MNKIKIEFNLTDIMVDDKEFSEMIDDELQVKGIDIDDVNFDTQEVKPQKIIVEIEYKEDIK